MVQYRRRFRGGRKSMFKPLRLKKISMAAKAYRLARKAATAIKKVEYKYADSGLVAVTPTNAVPYLWKLTNNIAQGVNEGQRVGNQICVKSIQVRGRMSIPTTTTNNRMTMRMIVYIDKEPKPGTAGSTSDVVAGGSDTIALSNFGYRASGRFKILYDKIFNLDLNTKRVYTWNHFFRCNAKPRWNAAAGTDADHVNDQIYIAFLTDQSGVNAPNVDANARLRYLDG